MIILLSNSKVLKAYSRSKKLPEGLNGMLTGIRRPDLLGSGVAALNSPGFFIYSLGLTISSLSAFCFQPTTQIPHPLQFSVITEALSFLDPGTFTISMALNIHLSTQSWQPTQVS